MWLQAAKFFHKVKHKNFCSYKDTHTLPHYQIFPPLLHKYCTKSGKSCTLKTAGCYNYKPMEEGLRVVLHTICGLPTYLISPAPLIEALSDVVALHIMSPEPLTLAVTCVD